MTTREIIALKSEIIEAVIDMAEDCKFDAYPEVQLCEDAFIVDLEIDWEIANYIEYLDECDYDFTGEWHSIMVTSVKHYDEDGNELAVPEKLIHDLNNMLN